MPSNVAQFFASTVQHPDKVVSEFRANESHTPADMSRQHHAKNTAKNRYRFDLRPLNKHPTCSDIHCLDASRVVLHDWPHDYIHANYVSGSRGARTFVCTQAPKDAVQGQPKEESDTIADFWHMVWQERAAVVCMLCHVLEAGSGRCAQYWPVEAGVSSRLLTFLSHSLLQSPTARTRSRRCTRSTRRCAPTSARRRRRWC